MSHPCRLLLLPIVAAILAYLAAAEVTLILPEETVLPSQDVVFTFNASLPGVQNCTLLLNGTANRTVAAGENQQVSIARELNPGVHNWSASCNSASAQQASQARQLTIDTAPPEVILLTKDGAAFNKSEVELAYSVQEEHLRNCTLLLDITSGTLQDVKSNLSPAAGKSAFTASLQDRQYSWNVKCGDSAGHSGKGLFTGTFKVDTTPPVLAILQPQGVVTAETATLSASTSEDAECRYSSSQDNHSLMGAFASTGGKTHQQALAFANDGSYSYFISCIDLYGNTLQAKKAEITVHLLPTAKIAMSDTSPVKAGIIDVTLTTSKPMASPPALSFSAPGRETAIALSGEGTVWKGSFLIEDTPERKIATYSFRGTDTAGYTGTIMGEGKTFVIDTVKPLPPTNIRAEPREAGTSVSWYPTSDDAVSYRIYRSASPAPGYLDFYVSVNSSPFIDLLVQDKATYYYRVAAQDEAGNLGGLSETVYATASGNAANVTVQEAAPPPLPPNLVVQVNDAARTVESVKLSMEGAQESMASLSGKAREFAEAAGVRGQAEEANKRLGQLLAQLESLKNEYQEEAQLKPLLAGITNEANKLERETVKDVRIEGHIEDIPLAGKDRVLKAVSKVFPEEAYGKEAVSKYVAANEKDMQDLQVRTEAEVATFSKANGETFQKTMITHTLAYTGAEPAQDSLVVLFIPKAVAEKSTELSYTSGRPEVIDDDPIIKWGFLGIGPEVQKISYISGRKLSDEDVRSIEVVPLLNVNRIGQGSTPTGFAVFRNLPGTGQFWLIMPGILIVLALGGYYYLTGPKEAEPQKEEEAAVPVPVLKELDQRLSTIQVEIDEEIYPLLTSIRNNILKKEKPSGSQILSALIKNAKGYAESGDTYRAKELYPAIQLMYQSLSKEHKARFSADCIWLYGELNKKREE